MFIVHLNQVFVKCIKSLLCVCSSADFIPAYVAHDMTKIVFFLRTTQPFIYIYIYIYTYAAFSSISICLAIWNTGKWSDISVIDNPCTEWFISPILLVNILSITVADVAVTLEGRVMSGRKPLHDIISISTNWAVCTWLAQFKISML